MQLNIDPDWIRRMAEKEDGGIVSVGGLVSRVNDSQSVRAGLLAVLSYEEKRERLKGTRLGEILGVEDDGNG